MLAENLKGFTLNKVGCNVDETEDISTCRNEPVLRFLKSMVTLCRPKCIGTMALEARVDLFGPGSAKPNEAILPLTTSMISIKIQLRRESWKAFETAIIMHVCFITSS